MVCYVVVMHRNDARKLTHRELTELRRRGVAAVQGGESARIVAGVLGVHIVTLFGWLARYRRGGWSALGAAKRGGRPPTLDAKKLQWLYNTITGKDPRQLNFPFALWTSRMVQVLIDRQFNIRLSKASVCRLLNQLGLSPQKPLWRALQKDPALVEKWLKKEYPKIRRLARKRKAEIFFGDEAGVRSDFHAGTTWAPCGCTPVVSTTGARFGLNIISAVSAQGTMRFMIVHERVTATVFIEFLKRLMYNATSPVFLIVDGHPAHKAGVVSEFVKSTEGMLRLFLLPPYSPELNPDEHVWNDLKNNAVGRTSITGPDQMKATVLSYMRKLQKLPERIASFFHAPETSYALAS
jgi:transposase